jgi:hypothetical protein
MLNKIFDVALLIGVVLGMTWFLLEYSSRY